MEILKHPFGDYQTNCYILKFPQGQIIVDAGIGASKWVIEQCENPLALLNTHGHFDHIWSDASLREVFPQMPLICHQKDAFMLESDCFELGLIPSAPTHTIGVEKGSESIKIEGIDITFHHFPGHTPGCCMIEIDSHLFSGDFIFYRCIGRYDFAYSNPSDMKESFQRIKNLQRDLPIHPGHGEDTSVANEQKHTNMWITRIKEEIC